MDLVINDREYFFENTSIPKSVENDHLLYTEATSSKKVVIRSSEWCAAKVFQYMNQFFMHFLICSWRFAKIIAVVAPSLRFQHFSDLFRTSTPSVLKVGIQGIANQKSETGRCAIELIKFYLCVSSFSLLLSLLFSISIFVLKIVSKY